MFIRSTIKLTKQVRKKLENKKTHHEKQAQRHRLLPVPKLSKQTTTAIFPSDTPHPTFVASLF